MRQTSSCVSRTGVLLPAGLNSLACADSMLTEAGEGDFYADVDPRIPTQQTDPKAHLLKMDPEAVILR